ncbi:MAG: hypothetical protein ACI87N_003529, partial [Flavobacteriales bacterium]
MKRIIITINNLIDYEMSSFFQKPIFLKNTFYIFQLGQKKSLAQLNVQDFT